MFHSFSKDAYTTIQYVFVVAIDGIDFNIVSSSVIIPSGAMFSKVANVLANADGLYEMLHETFELTIFLVGSDGAIIVNNTAIVSIVDQDG